MPDKNHKQPLGLPNSFDKELSNFEHFEAEYFRGLFENSPTMFTVCDAKGKILDINQIGARQLGYNSKQLLHQDIDTLYHPDEKATIKLKLKETLRYRSQIHSWDVQKVHAKGFIIWVREQARVIEDQQGKLLVLIVGHDISEEKLNLLRLEKQTRELARSNDELNQFATAASHDLRQPLRVIMGALQLLEKRYGTSISQEDKELVKLAEDSIHKMNSRIQGLHEHASIKPEPDDRGEIDLNFVVDYVSRFFKKEIKESGAMISCDLPTIFIEKKHVIILFKHLIENALKFGGTFIHISAIATDTGYQISIGDDGIGIEKQYFDQIFGIFKRLHTDLEYKGTGIGLATCKKIVEIHDGEIWVESDYGQGTTIHFTLPDYA